MRVTVRGEPGNWSIRYRGQEAAQIISTTSTPPASLATARSPRGLPEQSVPGTAAPGLLSPGPGKLI